MQQWRRRANGRYSNARDQLVLRATTARSVAHVRPPARDNLIPPLCWAPCSIRAVQCDKAHATRPTPPSPLRPPALTLETKNQTTTKTKTKTEKCDPHRWLGSSGGRGEESSFLFLRDILILGCFGVCGSCFCFVLVVGVRGFFF